MDISVTRFRADCLKLIRRVEAGGGPVDITRRGKVVARLALPPAVGDALVDPWERLHGSGSLVSPPAASVLDEAGFAASARSEGDSAFAARIRRKLSGRRHSDSADLIARDRRR